MRRYAQAAFVNASFFLAATGYFPVQPPVVAAIRRDGVSRHAQLFQRPAKPSNLLVQQDDFAVVPGHFLTAIKNRTIRNLLMRRMG